MCYQKEYTCRMETPLLCLLFKSFLKMPCMALLRNADAQMLILQSNEKLEVVTHQVTHLVGNCSPWLHDVQLCWVSGAGGTAECSGAELTSVLGAKQSGLCASLRLVLLGTDRVQWKVITICRWQPTYTEGTVTSSNALVQLGKNLILTVFIN